MSVQGEVRERRDKRQSLREVDKRGTSGGECGHGVTAVRGEYRAHHTPPRLGPESRWALV